jgi:hypothetical protein
MFFQSKDINVRFALWPYMGCAHTQLHTVGFRLKPAVAFMEMPAR